MKPRSVGILAGGGPKGVAALLREIISECQRKYKSWRSYAFPYIHFYNYPHSEMLLADDSCGIPSRDLSSSIQQLKLTGIDSLIIPCFTMSSYITYRYYGLELIEMGSMMKIYLENNTIKNPLVLCLEQMRQSCYCNRYFECQYPSVAIQKELDSLIEIGLQGEKIDIQPLLNQLPKVPIVCTINTINTQLAKEVNDPRWITPIQALIQYVDMVFPVRY